MTMAMTGGLTAQGVDPGTSNLKHSWKFNDGTADDHVGGANGTLVGGAAIVDGALVTSAQGQWMEMPGDVIALNTYDAVTIEAWYTPDPRLGKDLSCTPPPAVAVDFNDFQIHRLWRWLYKWALPS